MSSKSDNLMGCEYSVAEMIFDDEMMVKYKSGEKFYVDLFNDTNEVFPQKFMNLSFHESLRNDHLLKEATCDQEM